MKCEKVLLIHSHEIALCYIGQVLYVHFYDVMFNLFQFYMLWAMQCVSACLKLPMGIQTFSVVVVLKKQGKIGIQCVNCFMDNTEQRVPMKVCTNI